MNIEHIEQLKRVALELMDALKTNGLGEVVLETDDAKIKVQAQPSAPAARPADVTAPVPETASPSPADPAEEIGTPVKSPLVGTFYSSPAPDAPPFVLVGQQVKKGDTLFIVEAMKTMNEIKSPCDGTVARILAQPGDMVEYNQTVVVIEE